MTEQEIIIDVNILMGIFKALVEQTTTLTGHLSQKTKKDFNQFQKLGFKLLNGLEKNNKLNEEYLNTLSDAYHEVGIILKTEAQKKLNGK